jgi:DNA-binding NarL/FixJ family response regulator
VPSSLSVILADDHSLVRAGIRSLLEQLPNLTIVAEAGDGREALALVQARTPDVIVMDITMPGLNGLDATARIVQEHPRTKVLILSMHTGEEYVRHALRAGASGYLLKDAATTELALAIEALRHNRSYLSSAISKDVIDRHRRQSQDPKSRPVKPLTPRMREILQLIAEGDSTKEIAHRLSLSVKTIETHRMHLMARLNIHDVAGLVRYALRNGLISAEK